MYSLIFLAVCSFLLSFALTPLCRDLFRRWGILDTPGDPRKLHREPIPRVGGIPIAISYAASYGILFLFPLHGGLLIHSQLPFVWRLFPAVSLVFATGLLDDLIGLKPWQKLVGQLGAATLAIWAGVKVSNIIGYSSQSWWTFPVTIIWLLACTNAFNLIDGIDGLASGLGLLATLTTLVAGLLQNNMALAFATVPLTGALLAFLRYNFNPATIFLGDSGSMLIGFLLGSYAIIWSQKSATLLGMTAPMMVLGIPLLDVGLAIIRRFLRRQPIFGADRGHIHHRLLDRGFSPRRAALTLYAASGIFAVLSLLGSVFHAQYIGVVIVLFCAVAWLGIRNLNYIEFHVLKRMLRGGQVQHLLNAQICLRGLDDSLTAATTVEEFWIVIRQAAQDFGFNSVRFYVNGQILESQISHAAPDRCWTLRIPISDNDYINFSREFRSRDLPVTIGPFIDLLRSSLEKKLHDRSVTPAAEIGVAAN